MLKKLFLLLPLLKTVMLIYYFFVKTDTFSELIDE